MSKLKKAECQALLELVLHTTSIEQAVAAVKTVTPSQAVALCEIVLNITLGNLTLTQGQKNKFARHKTLLRKLCHSKTSTSARIKLLKSKAKIVTSLLRILKQPLLNVLRES